MEICIIWDLGLYAIGHWIRAEIAVRNVCSRASGGILFKKNHFLSNNYVFLVKSIKIEHI